MTPPGGLGEDPVDVDREPDEVTELAGPVDSAVLDRGDVGVAMVDIAVGETCVLWAGAMLGSVVSAVGCASAYMIVELVAQNQEVAESWSLSE